MRFVVPGRFSIQSSEIPASDSDWLGRDALQLYVPLARVSTRLTSRSEAGLETVHDMSAGTALVIPVLPTGGAVFESDGDAISIFLSREFIKNAVGSQAVLIEGAFTIQDPFVLVAARQFEEVLAAGAPSLPLIEALVTGMAYRVGVAAKNTSASAQVRGRARALSGPQLAKVQSFIDERLGTEISVASLAEHMCMSPWHFMRRFKATCGVSALSYVADRRFERAKSLLLESTLSIGEVAFKIGLTHNHFSRRFSQRFGMSPSHARSRGVLSD